MLSLDDQLRLVDKLLHVALHRDDLAIIVVLDVFWQLIENELRFNLSNVDVKAKVSVNDYEPVDPSFFVVTLIEEDLSFFEVGMHLLEPLSELTVCNHEVFFLE